MSLMVAEGRSIISGTPRFLPAAAPLTTNRGWASSMAIMQFTSETAAGKTLSCDAVFGPYVPRHPRKEKTCRNCSKTFQVTGTFKVYCPVCRTTCAYSGCSDSPTSCGYCAAHYQRLRTGRAMDGPLLRRRNQPIDFCLIPGCRKRPTTRGMCPMHYQRWRHGTPIDAPLKKEARLGRGPGFWIGDDGYVRRVVPEGTPGSYYAGRRNTKRPRKPVFVMLEHRYVMQEFLGRALLQTETPHHIFGDRSDNRLERLELWTTSQPQGQRVVDKVVFAVEILTLYPEFTGLDLVDRAQLSVILEKVNRKALASPTAKRRGRLQ